MIFLIIVLNALSILLVILQGLLLIRILMSWLPINKDTSFYRIVLMLTEPILTPVSWMIKHSIFGSKTYILDFTPLITILIISGLHNYIQSNLVYL